MTKKWKVLRNQKGFTLVELMIVVAVIGILALVLIPKVGTIKTQAKTAGIDVNERMVQAIVQAQITDYAGKGSAGTNGATVNETTFANAITNALNNQDQSQNIKDPFNSWSGAAFGVPGSILSTGTSVNPITNPAVYVDVAGVQTNSVGPVALNASPNNVGIIYVQVYPASATANCDIYVQITPYDASGNPIQAKQVTIRP